VAGETPALPGVERTPAEPQRSVAADGKPEAFRKGSGEAAKVNRVHDEGPEKILVAALLRCVVGVICG
jgi:hypothetical protein